MAALVRLGLQKTGQQFSMKCSLAGSIDILPKRYKSGTKHNKHIKAGLKLESVAESLASKGYLRSQKPYTPSENVLEKINTILKGCSNTNTSLKSNRDTLNINDKYRLLNECFICFQHGVPNSQIHEINTVDDIIAFYQKPVSTTLPLDAMKTMELPTNLHIQHEYVRFNPETDTMFNGKTAFPRSSTLVTGLKARKKYEGHIVKRSWP